MASYGARPHKFEVRYTAGSVYNWEMLTRETDPHSEPLIELANISLKFADHWVFQNFNLRLFEGESLVLVGPSGSGKSLLMKLMTGLVCPDHGAILYRGESLSTLSKIKLSRMRAEMGFLFQQNALFDSMTVHENMDFTLSEVHPKKSKEQRGGEIQDLLKAVGLDHVMSLFPSELSGGMQKRLGIARALILQPRVVFYDDPTAGLDPITSRKIVQLILSLKEKSSGTIVTVTHDMMRAYQLAGRIQVCFLGEFIETGGAQQTRFFPHPKVQQFIKGEISGPVEVL